MYSPAPKRNQDATHYLSSVLSSVSTESASFLQSFWTGTSHYTARCPLIRGCWNCSLHYTCRQVLLTGSSMGFSRALKGVFDWFREFSKKGECRWCLLVMGIRWISYKLTLFLKYMAIRWGISDKDWLKILRCLQVRVQGDANWGCTLYPNDTGAWSLLVDQQSPCQVPQKLERQPNNIQVGYETSKLRIGSSWKVLTSPA